MRVKNLVKKGSTNYMILFLSFSNVISNVLNIIGGLIVAKFLLPTELGQFNAFSIFTGYLILLQLGVPSALSRELPFYLGKNDKSQALAYAATSQFWQKGLANLALLISAILATYFFLSKDFISGAGALVIGIGTWQGLYVTKYLSILYRTNRDFDKLSKIKIIVAFVQFGGVLFVYYYGFYGLCLRFALTAFIEFLFKYAWRPVKVKAKWSKFHFIEMTKLGLPMFAVANIYGLWPLVQRTVILSMGGTKALGLFAICIIVENSMKTISTSVSSVIYPSMASGWGKGLSVGELMKKAFKPVMVSGGLILLVTPIAWFLLPEVVNKLLPKYLEGVLAAKFMLLVGVLSIFNVFNNIYNVIKDQKRRLFMYITGIGVWLIVVYVGYFVNGFSLELFPFAMIFAYLTMILILAINVKSYWNLRAEPK